MKKITGSLPFRLLLGVILGIIVGQLAGSGLMHVVVTIKYILNQVLVFIDRSSPFFYDGRFPYDSPPVHCH